MDRKPQFRVRWSLQIETTWENVGELLEHTDAETVRGYIIQAEHDAKKK